MPTEHMKVLLQSVKMKGEFYHLSFSASDIAIITGFHPYGNIVNTFLKYLYQHLDLLYEIDLSILQIENLSVDEEMTRILSRCSTEKQQELQHFTKTIIENTQHLQNHQQVKEVLKKSTELLQSERHHLSNEDYEFIQEELMYRIKTNYGRFNEEKALDYYEEITGFPVVERNEAYFILEVPVLTFPVVEEEHLDCTPSKNCEDTIALVTISKDPPEPPMNTLTNEGTVISKVTEVQTKYVAENLEIIDLCDTSNEERPLPSESARNTTIITPATTSLAPSCREDPLEGSIAAEKKEKISDFFTQVKRISSSTMTSNSSSCSSYNNTPTTDKANKPQQQMTTMTTTLSVEKKAISRSSPTVAMSTAATTTSSSASSSVKSKKMKKSLAFAIIGKVDGISYPMDASSDDVNQWKQHKIVVEMKNRVNRIRCPPPLYEQIQLTAYLIMTNSFYGDLVQVMPEEDEKEEGNDDINGNSNNCLKGKATSGDVAASETSAEGGHSSLTHSHSSSSSDLAPLSKRAVSSTSSSRPPPRVNASFSDYSYQTETFSITRIAVDGPPYYHRYHWDTVIIPRLHIFKDMIQMVRQDDALRHSFLLASEEERRSMIYHLCPYFQS